MSGSRTGKTAPATASSAEPREVRLTAPTAWKDLTQEQLRYALTLMAGGVEGDPLKTFMLIRFNGITVTGRRREGWRCVMDKRVFYLRRWQVAAAIDKMKFIDTYEDMDVRLDGIHGLHAVDALLHQVPFFDYLKMEIALQGFMRTGKETPLRSLARLLYRDGKGRTVDGTPFDRAELLGAYLWYSYIKRVFAAEFPDFFRPAPADGAEEYDVMAATDAQIRALTDGDITKEKAVYEADTWRALTELNAKAREARQLAARLKQHK